MESSDVPPSRFDSLTASSSSTVYCGEAAQVVPSTPTIAAYCRCEWVGKPGRENSAVLQKINRLSVSKWLPGEDQSLRAVTGEIESGYLRRIRTPAAGRQCTARRAFARGSEAPGAWVSWRQSAWHKHRARMRGKETVTSQRPVGMRCTGSLDHRVLKHTDCQDMVAWGRCVGARHDS